MSGASSIRAQWFDGHSAQARPVRVHLDGGTLTLLDEADEPHAFALRGVVWPERTRHGQRVAQLPGGGSLVFADAAAFDDWRRAHGGRESWVVKAQQHWRATAAAVLGLVAVVAAAYVWGVPWAAERIVAAVPPALDSRIGDSALAQLREGLLEPSKLPAERQQQWRTRFAALLQQAQQRGAGPRAEAPLPVTLHFAGGGRLGPNAVALPGGHIVVTDELLALLHDSEDAVLGVLAHEYGHVQRQHGLNALVRFTLVSAGTSVALGDFSAVLAGVPALLAHLGYSREAEREADGDAAAVLLATGRDPAAMVLLFERLAERGKSGKGGQADGGDGGLPIAFASHPADAERIRFFREYAQKRR